MCLRIITRHRKMRHRSFSNIIIPRLAAYLASLDLMCVSSEEKGGIDKRARHTIVPDCHSLTDNFKSKIVRR